MRISNPPSFPAESIRYYAHKAGVSFKQVGEMFILERAGNRRVVSLAAAKESIDELARIPLTRRLPNAKI